MIHQNLIKRRTDEQLWEATDLAYPDLCTRLLDLAIERHTSARSHEF